MLYITRITLDSSIASDGTPIWQKSLESEAAIQASVGRKLVSTFVVLNELVAIFSA